KLPVPKAMTTAMDAKHQAEAARLINGGLSYLVGQVNKSGGWSIHGKFEPAVTGLVLKALVQHPGVTVETPIVKRGYERLLSFQQADGAIYDPKQGRSNYCTAIATCALVAANNPKFKPNLDKAVKYLRSLQIAPGSKSRDPQKPGQAISKDSPYLGGVSYGKQHGRPDMNNLGWWMQAMHDAGVSADDPAMQQALTFVTRCQNRSESNNLAWAKDGGNDGGLIYAPAKRNVGVGESKAGPGPGGRGLRSYGSITYVGLKSMLYAGLTKDDPRVRSAYAWIRKHWTLDANPNMPAPRSRQGMYFYYNVFSKALRAFGEAEIPDPKNPKVKHNWREQLVDALAKRVRKDGSWINTADRWEEGSAVLVTAYEVLALEEVMKK
ncbi:MAG: terpene cyclase/mutase family protein, partial [Phycisphaerae bacterium]|nr:terpene cyclase/mutase family protein [Phycisphaerae bacterium]